jgi:hypothetical protein
MHEIEQQCMQRQQAVPADGAILTIASAGLPLQPAGVVVELHGLALGQRLEADFLARAIAPDWPQGAAGYAEAG